MNLTSRPYLHRTDIMRNLEPSDVFSDVSDRLLFGYVAHSGSILPSRYYDVALYRRVYRAT